MVTGIILTAGKSSRFGSPKALVPFKGSPVVQYLQRTLISSKMDEIIIVLGADSDLIKPYILNHKKVRIVHNKDHKFGQTSSFKCGVKMASLKTSAVMLFPVDCPFINKSTINELIDCYKKEKHSIIIPQFKERKGHPPLFSADFRDQIMALDNDTGINTIAQENGQHVITLPVEDRHILTTFNTQKEWEWVHAQLVCDRDKSNN